ncbi:hypothetical protein [Alkalibacillus haloalkaliphilus]|uniref:Uncharacterized protein n=1 Tax=Alkalibacillus haloalkaliphilus TaxID=94136 RepID=A0A511W379_9BACI|nr:hypothetical protein [Alkalibacillus haloalkaliphilus]GEN45545.1 hypothetical protein AHA02nite_13210 [Alkalibacillus haloalkaliphilus]
MQYRLFNTQEVEALQERLRLYENMFQDFYESEAFEDYLLMKNEVHALKKQIVKIEGVLKVVNEHQQEQDQKIKAQRSGQSDELKSIIQLLQEVKTELASIKGQHTPATEQSSENNQEEQVEQVEPTEDSSPVEHVQKPSNQVNSQTSRFLQNAKQTQIQKPKKEAVQPKSSTQPRKQRTPEFRQLQHLIRSNATSYVQPNQASQNNHSPVSPRFKTRVSSGRTTTSNSGNLSHTFKPRNYPSKYDQIQPRTKRRKKKRSKPKTETTEQPKPTAQTELKRQEQQEQKREPQPTTANQAQHNTPASNQSQQQTNTQSFQPKQTTEKQQPNKQEESVLEKILPSQFFKNK